MTKTNLALNRRSPSALSAHTIASPTVPIVNAFSVDVEDYFQVAAFDSVISRESWGNRELRVEDNVNRLLQLFDAHKTKATFFTLGWIAERLPAMVKLITREGHELANHGYLHDRVTSLNQSEFREDVIRAKGILEDLPATPPGPRPPKPPPPHHQKEHPPAPLPDALSRNSSPTTRWKTKSPPAHADPRPVSPHSARPASSASAP